MKSLSLPARGFTLQELLLVMLIIGILAGLSVAGFTALTQSQQAKNAGYELHSSLVLARSEAIKRNANVTIAPVSASWQDGWTITPAGGTTLKTQSALSGVIITTTSASITYTRSGRLPTTVLTMPTFEIDVSNTATSNIRCINIELTGLPRTVLGACS